MESTSIFELNRRPRRPFLRAFVILGLCALLPLVAHGKLKVVATTPDFAALAREIGGDRVEVTSLAKPTDNPHFVHARPSVILKLHRADVLIEDGAQLETGWLAPIVGGARSPKILKGGSGNIVAIAGIEILEVPAKGHQFMGDIHSVGNPHYPSRSSLSNRISNGARRRLWPVRQGRPQSWCPSFRAA